MGRSGVTPFNGLLKQNPGIMLPPQATMVQAMEAMTKCRLGVALVVDKKKRLVGVVTDLDIRRALLKGGDLRDPLSKVMTRDPITAAEAATREELASLFQKTNKAYIPVVAGAGKLVGLAALTDYATIPHRHPNWVVIMAGGMGKRLLPLTENMPKPLIRVGNKPILELMLEQLINSGFYRFILTVNYLADQIKDYCGDGSRWGVQIEYVEEKKPLGTAGALGLIKRDLGGTFLVANGDIMTKVDFGALLRFHHDEKALATVCIKQHEIQVPYGVVELGGHKLARIVEKPTQRFFVNAGIYALEPAALKRLPKGKHCHMTDFLQKTQSKKKGSVACFPLQEYWLDVGRIQDYERATGEYAAQFGK
jgi:dTDP-glucose pyrophosphorylase/CBS domain-containing protein